MQWTWGLGVLAAGFAALAIPVRVRLELSGIGTRWRLFGAVALGPWWAWRRSWALSARPLRQPGGGGRPAVGRGAAVGMLRRVVVEAAWIEGAFGLGDAACTAMAAGAASALFYGLLAPRSRTGALSFRLAPCWQRRVLTGSVGGIGRLRVGDIMAAGIEGLLAGRRKAHGRHEIVGRTARAQPSQAGAPIGGRPGIAPH